MSDGKLGELLLNPSLIRNRLKIEGVRRNARGFIEIQEE